MGDLHLELIDLTAPIQRQAEQMAASCESVGFFRIPVDAVDRDVADAAWTAAGEFFALPDDEKRRIEFPEPGYPYGYSPLGYETLARSLDGVEPAKPDLKESLSVGPDCGSDASGSASDGWPADEVWIRSPSLWPERPAGLREVWEAYYRDLSRVAEHLLSVMAVALDLPADHFSSLIDRPITSMRAIHYPALDVVPPGALRAGAHSDYGTLTILRTDDVPGLQIRTDSDRWVDVAPHDGSFVVNLGDSIAQWTNERWRSTVHRVVVSDPRPRQSFAFFHMANWDATIDCLPTCVADGAAPRHEPVQAGPWLMGKFQSTVA